MKVVYVRLIRDRLPPERSEIVPCLLNAFQGRVVRSRWSFLTHRLCLQTNARGDCWLHHGINLEGKMERVAMPFFTTDFTD